MRTSAIVLNHRHTAESSDDVKLLQNQITLLTLQLQFERNRREVHAERNRRLLGKSRNSRALDEHNSALVSCIKYKNLIIIIPFLFLFYRNIRFLCYKLNLIMKHQNLMNSGKIH